MLSVTVTESRHQKAMSHARSLWVMLKNEKEYRHTVRAIDKTGMDVKVPWCISLSMKNFESHKRSRVELD